MNVGDRMQMDHYPHMTIQLQKREMYCNTPVWHVVYASGKDCLFTERYVEQRFEKIENDRS